MPRVSAAVLIWARESAGFTVEEAAPLVVGGVRAVERLSAIESGEVDPTRTQILAMSKRYHRPLVTFYLREPPEAANRAHDFRTVRASQAESEGRLSALIRDVRARQSLVLDALETADESEPLAFVGSVKQPVEPDALAAAIVRTWGLSIAAFRAERTADLAFKLFRECVERTGVFVILQGNLGHYTSNIDPKVFRGFAIADKIAPFIVINETDARTAWTFTLLHELGHILLGQSGVSGYHSDDAIERLCDQAASKILLAGDLDRADLPQNASPQEVGAFINEFARARKLSRSMVAYNLMGAGRISRAFYGTLAAAYDEEREERVAGPGGGGDYYVTRRHRVGPGLIKVVDRLVAEGSLSSTKAARVLGVNPTAVGRMTANPQAA